MQERLSDFTDAGVAVVALTYDEYEQNAKFSEAEDLSYPLLSDQDVTTVKNFGILNEQHEEGSGAYGVPHPGVVLIDEDDKIVLKRAEEQYSSRPSMDELAEAIREFLDMEEKTEDEENIETTSD